MIALNDACNDGEREALIGPHLFTPVGTANPDLIPQRLERVVRFAFDNAANALDTSGIDHRLREDFGRDYYAAYLLAEDIVSSAVSVLPLARRAVVVAREAARIVVEHPNIFAEIASSHAVRSWAYSYYADPPTASYDAFTRLLDLILELCAIGERKECVPAMGKDEVLRAVCGVRE